MIKQGANPVTEIIVHCAATRPEWMAGRHISAKVDEIDGWHRARGWRGIGYHWVIDRDGTVAPGRPETTQGAHVEGHNRGTIGICLIGGHGSEAFDRFEDHFTPAQDAALRHLIDQIERRAGPLKISGHNDYARKACPGFQVDRWIASHPAPAPRPAPATSIPTVTPRPASGGFWAWLAGLFRR